MVIPSTALCLQPGLGSYQRARAVHTYWSCLFNPAVPHSHKRALTEHPYVTVLGICACCAWIITFVFI